MHETRASADNKTFIVTRRFGRNLLNKSFGTLPEARRWWDEQVKKLEDQGLVRSDLSIMGFHEEG